MKNIFIICAMVFAFNIMSAQNSISGKISDQDGMPLTGATVFIPDMNKGSVSDHTGFYELTNLPDGKIKILYSYIGYCNHIETIILKGKTAGIDISLTQTPVESEEIVISGGYQSSQHENTIKIEVLKMDPIRIKSTPNFSEVITKIPGVDMISKGSGVSKPVIRGLSMNDILILNNGVRFENYQYSSHHPLGIDEFGIEDIEVIKGPASLLYGSDAIGGVINFIKERPAPVGSIIGDYNLQLFSNTIGMINNLGVKGASKNFFYGIRAGHKTNSDFIQGGGKYVPNSRFNEMSVKANSGFTNKNGTFKLFYDVNNQNLGLVEDEAVQMINKRSRDNEVFYQNLNTHLFASQNKLYIGKYKLDLNAAYQNTNLIHFGEKDVYEIQMQLATLTYEAKINLPSKEGSEYIIGFQGYNQSNTNLNNRETILLPDATINNYSAFALLRNAVLNKLYLQTGARYDIRVISSESVGLPFEDDYRTPLEKDFGSVSGSLGLIYNRTENLLFRTNFAVAFRSPNLAELTSNGLHELRYEIGDENLKPENSFEGDLSLHYHKENLTIDMAGFFNQINDYIFLAPTEDTTTYGYYIHKYSQSNSFLYGGEAGLHYHPEFVGWLHFETTYATVTGKQSNGKYLPFIPAHKLRFDFRVEKEQLWFLKKAFASVNTLSVFDQNNAAPDETNTSGYFLLDFSIGGKIKKDDESVLFSLSVNNLLDKKYIDHLSTLKEVNYLNPGRNISLSLKIPFGKVGVNE